MMLTVDEVTLGVLMARMAIERKTEIEEQKAAMQSVLEMIASDETSPLYSHFRNLMSPVVEGVTGDPSTNRAFFIAGTVLKAAAKGWLKIPAPLDQLMQELVSRAY
jgi:hypothetical protein